MDASRPGAWTFPRGTRLWKEFSLGGRRVETRLLERLADGTWRFASFAWLPDGSDAVRVGPEGVRRAAVSASGTPYDIPSQADCRACHEGRASPVLGFDALQLSPDRDPLAPHAEEAAPGSVDLPAAVRRGLVRNLPAGLLARPPRVPGRSPTERAALGYLHANCAGCHATATPELGGGLVLEHDLRARRAGDEPAVRTAVARPSRFVPPGAAGAGLRVAPGDPAASTLLGRMRTRDPLRQMPPVGTHLADEAGAALVEAWIEGVAAPASEGTGASYHGR